VINVTNTHETITAAINERLVNTLPLQQAIDDLNNQRNAEIEAVNKRFNAKIDPLMQRRQENIDAVVELAFAHRQVLTDNDRSKKLKLRGGTIQWRNSPASLVFDASESVILNTIRRLKGMRRFTVRKLTIDKVALKKDRLFVAKLIKVGVAHFEEKENFVITLPDTKSEIVTEGNPYKVELPR